MKKKLILVVVTFAITFGLNAQQNDNMVRIEGGTFTMGSPEDEKDRADYELQHQVTVSSFYIGKYEVTQKEYQGIMKENPSNFKGENLPVEQVKWYDAIDFCNKLSKKEGLTPVYKITRKEVIWNRKANGYRLPTEAEWEYACRAGTTTAFNTGADISNDTGWYSANSSRKTHPVGQKPPNAWSLYDMHGNVGEWCWDLWAEGNGYTSEAQADPIGASSGTGRIARGGSWYYIAPVLRSAFRMKGRPIFEDVDLGFRIARNAK